MRYDYLNDLADEYEVPSDYVFTLAYILGENEDYDGLICALEDFAYDMDCDPYGDLEMGFDPYMGCYTDDC